MVLGHVGRLAPEKNLDYLARAAAVCLKEKTSAWFAVIGEGPSRAAIEAVFRERGVLDRLVAPGAETGRRLADAYAAMDLFLFSSTSETQGLVLAEAMASKTPVVALEASGSREVVEDGRNGRLLAEDSPEEEFAEAVLELMADPRTLGQMGLNALETARGLSRERCAERLEVLYKEVLEEVCKSGPAVESLAPWDSVLGALKAEWELISGKTRAAVSSLRLPKGSI
jgi:glycosyltransferase involved in cell wall biosynthesis